MTRTKPKIIPKLKFWKADKDKWYCEAQDLRAQMEASGRELSEIQRLMGHGYHLIEDAIRGERMSSYNVQLIEYGIIKAEPREVSTTMSREDIYGKKS